MRAIDLAGGVTRSEDGHERIDALVFEEVNRAVIERAARHALDVLGPREYSASPEHHVIGGCRLIVGAETRRPPKARVYPRKN
jgi:hypothetical protein